jgi:hypothetical protein
MDASNIRLQVSKFEKARNSLLALIGITALNTFLVLFGADFIFFINPSVISYFSDLPVIAFIGVGFYAVCFLLAKRVRAFLLVAFIVFLLDSLLFGLFVVFDWLDGWFEIFDLIDVAFHVFILVALIRGLAAWGKLNKVSADDVAAALDGVTQEELLDESFDGSIAEHLYEEYDGIFYVDGEEAEVLFARWQDNFYYPAVVLEYFDDQLKVNYLDGDSGMVDKDQTMDLQEAFNTLSFQGNWQNSGLFYKGIIADYDPMIMNYNDGDVEEVQLRQLRGQIR